MSKNAITWSKNFFDTILTSAGVEQLTEDKARAVMAEARLTAPVGEVNGGTYRDGIKLVKEQAAYRPVFRVVAEAPHSMVVESRTGNLARALKSVRG